MEEDNGTSTKRPTTSELCAAMLAMSDMAKAGIFTKAPRVVDATVACAIVMRTNEFKSDREAKQRFGIPGSTAVRKLWVPRLEALDVWRGMPLRGRKQAFAAHMAQRAAAAATAASAPAEPHAIAQPPPRKGCSRATVPGRKRGRPPNASYPPEVQLAKREKVEQKRAEKCDFPPPMAHRACSRASKSG